MLNNLNAYHRDIIGSNIYHEMKFPIIGFKPDLEEYTNRVVWDDERIYYKSQVFQSSQYDQPDYYLSTATRFRGVSIGHISRISGKKNAGWFPVQRGDFYITERQLLLFDKGPNNFAKFINLAFDSEFFKRGVRIWPLELINYIEGDLEDGAILLGAKNKEQYKFKKMNEHGQETSFEEDELRYIVNLVGSLIEKTLHE